MDVEPVVLAGKYVRLEPLEIQHAADLVKVAEPSLFKYFITLQPEGQTMGDLAKFVRQCQALPDTLTLAVIHRETNRAIGTTSFMDIRPSHKALEIGMTWIARRYQHTLVNPEMKLLMLDHAFEQLRAERVQLKTDGRNIQSQKAIEKLGARKEGVLRRHMVTADGYVHDTVMYSIVADEWPSVRQSLLQRLRPPDHALEAV